MKDKLQLSNQQPAPVLVVGSVAYDNIETPEASDQRILGGSASYASIAASYFAPARIVGVVGHDFAEHDVATFDRHGVDTAGLQIDTSGPTFTWSGRYHENFNQRETLDIQLNVFESFRPEIPPAFLDSPYILLGNIHPALQLHVRQALEGPGKFFAADTIDLWINIEKAKLLEVFQRIDLLIINESEAELLTGHNNVILAGAALRALGPNLVIIKKGSHGACFFHPDGLFTLPAYPVTELHDPTGAGDAFAGALLGAVSALGGPSIDNIKKAMLFGTAVASLAVEAFSLRRLENAGVAVISERVQTLREITRID